MPDGRTIELRPGESLALADGTVVRALSMPGTALLPGGLPIEAWGRLTRRQAVALFGSARATAKACRVTESAVAQWPDVLSEATSDRVLAAVIRTRAPQLFQPSTGQAHA